MLNRWVAEAEVFLSHASPRESTFQHKWSCPMVAQETVLHLCLIKFIGFSQHYKQFITVISPCSSVPLTHLTPPGNGQCQPSASAVPRVITSGAERAQYVIIFNLSSVWYHSALPPFWTREIRWEIISLPYCFLLPVSEFAANNQPLSGPEANH